MIEIELKFQVDEEEKKSLLFDAEFKKSKVNIDSYYDTNNFDLVKKDIWLRDRNGRFELKLPRTGNDQSATSYEEIEEDKKIKNYFSFDQNVELKTSLRLAGYRPFSTFKTERETYERDGITLDFDSTIFDQDTDNPFVMVEAEIMVADGTDIIREKQALKDKVKGFGVALNSGGGKGSEYFRRYQPKIYKDFFNN